MRVAAFLMSVLLVAAGCDGSGKKLYIDTKDLGPACAAYTACFGFLGMSRCVVGLDLLRHYEIENTTLELAKLNIFTDWLEMIALAQNVRCVVSAGGDCEKVLACMNQGVSNKDCTPDEDHILGYHCVGDSKLAKCMHVQGRFYSNVELSVSCSDMGLKCAEMPVNGGDSWVTCVNEIVSDTGGIHVTCDGTVASISFGGGVLKEDCKTRGATCAPGSYESIDLIEDYAFCIAPACDDSTFVDRCEGNDRLYCYDGRQVSVSCDDYGLVCHEEVSGTDVEVSCTYPGCTVIFSGETCDNGTVTYCGPENYRSVSCTDLGFLGCGYGPGETLVGCF